MSYQVDLEAISLHDQSRTNFGYLLLKLCMKADLHNLSLLRKAFPNAVMMVEHWRETGVNTLDLPYD